MLNLRSKYVDVDTTKMATRDCRCAVHPLVSIAAIFFIWSLASNCKKSKLAPPIDQIPAITMEGKNTFGCLIDGEAFKPKGNFSVSSGHCFYQKIYSSDVGYSFVVNAYRDGPNCTGKQVSLNVDSLKLEHGKTYQLGAVKTGDSYGKHFWSKNCSQIVFYETTEMIGGELKIIFLDTINQIVSGTFWFDALAPDGDTVHIREGRFDREYSQ